MQLLVGFSTSEWVVSRIIRYFTKAPVSHAFILIKGTELGDLVLEAEACGFKLSTVKALTRGTTHIVHAVYPPVTQDVLFTALQQAMQWIDERYNYPGLFGMALVSIGRWFGKKWRNPVRGAGSMFCSEAVTFWLQIAKCPGISSLDPDSVSPEDLYDFLVGDGGTDATPPNGTPAAA